VQLLLRITGVIDRINRGVGRGIAWLTLIMIGLGSFNALARYAGRFLGIELSSNTFIEAQWYLFGMLFLLGAAEALATDRHVRVDVAYARFSERGRHLINLTGGLALLLPFCLLALSMSVQGVLNSWSVLEQSPDPGGLPRYPIKTVIPIAFWLLFLQGLSQCIKHGVALLGYSAPEEPSDD